MAVVTPTSASQLMSSFVRFDAEFFKPEFIDNYQKVSSIAGIISLGNLTRRITQGSNPKFTQSGLPCVNGKNVYFGTMTEGEPNFVSHDEFERLSGYTLQRNDLVITLKHATKVGRIWIVEDDEPRIFSRNVGLIRLKDDSPVKPSVLLLYLWTKQGQLLIDRCATGGTTGQITLPMSELRQLPVPPIEKDEQEIINNLFWKSRDCIKTSVDAITQAQQLLESELGLDKLRFDKPVGYTARFSVVGLSASVNANRIDAQCFSPEAVFYEDWLLKHANCDRLGLLLASTAKGRQQAEAETGTTDYCSIKHITGREIVGASKAYPSAGTPTARKDDLLLAITGATIGKIGIVNRYDNLIYSGDMLRLRANGSVSPHYLLLTLDNHLGQVQFNRWITGSTNGHLSPRDVGKVLVPRLAPETEEQIAALVAESLEKRQESEQLLEQAKSRVEQLIEEAVQA